MIQDANDPIMRNSIFGWIIAGTGVLLSIPLIAMQFTGAVNWKTGDFVVMGAMLIGFASGFVVIARRLSPRGRAIAAIVVLAAFAWLWAELAVGILTDWGS